MLGEFPFVLINERAESRKDERRAAREAEVEIDWEHWKQIVIDHLVSAMVVRRGTDNSEWY